MGFIAPFIPSIISGVGTIFGAHEASKGAETAAGQQAASGQQAIAAMQQQQGNANAQLNAARQNLLATGSQQGQLYQQAQQNLAPYTSLGAGAAGLLGQGLGVAVSQPQPLSSMSAAPPTAPMTAPAPQPVTYAPGIQQGGGWTTTDPGNAQGIVKDTRTPWQRITNSGPDASHGGALRSLDTTPAAQAALTRSSSYGSPDAGGDTTLMEAPDGSRQQVPSALVAHYKAAGAKVVAA